LNHSGYLPEFVTITDGKTSDIEAGRALEFPKGSMVAIDRGYNDYGWYNQLTTKGIYFDFGACSCQPVPDIACQCRSLPLDCK